MNTPDTPAPSAAPDKPWHAQAICCGRDDGTYDFATRGDAELFRSQYTAGAGVAGPGLPGGHDRSVIITGRADQSEREAGTVLAEYLEAMRADKGMRGMIEECIALCVEVRANLTAETLRADRAENARDQVGEMLHTAQEQRNQASARWHEERKHAAEAERERDLLRNALTVIRMIVEESATDDADLLRQAILEQLPPAVPVEGAQGGAESNAGAPAAALAGTSAREGASGSQEPAEHRPAVGPAGEGSAA